MLAIHNLNLLSSALLPTPFLFTSLSVVFHHCENSLGIAVWIIWTVSEVL